MRVPFPLLPWINTRSIGLFDAWETMHEIKWRPDTGPIIVLYPWISVSGAIDLILALSSSKQGVWSQAFFLSYQHDVQECIRENCASHNCPGYSNQMGTPAYKSIMAWCTTIKHYQLNLFDYCSIHNQFMEADGSAPKSFWLAGTRILVQLVPRAKMSVLQNGLAQFGLKWRRHLFPFHMNCRVSKWCQHSLLSRSHSFSATAVTKPTFRHNRFPILIHVKNDYPRSYTHACTTVLLHLWAPTFYAHWEEKKVKGKPWSKAQNDQSHDA